MGRLKGMIRPGMAMTHGEAKRIARRKTAWLALYLRERRTPEKMLKRMFRRKHFQEARPTKGEG